MIIDIHIIPIEVMVMIIIILIVLQHNLMTIEMTNNYLIYSIDNHLYHQVHRYVYFQKILVVFSLLTLRVCVCALIHLYSLTKNTEIEAASIIQSDVLGYLTRKQTHQDQQRQLHQLEHEESNIDQYRQSSQMTEVNVLLEYSSAEY